MNVALGEICSYRSEKANASNIGSDLYISTESMAPNKGGISPASSIPETGRVSLFRQGDTLVSNIRPYFKKIWHADQNGYCSNDILVFEPNDASISDYLYWLLSGDQFFDYVMATSKGTKMPRGDKSAIMNYAVPSNDETARRMIVSIMNPIQSKIEANTKLNGYLEELALALYTEYLEWSDGELPAGWVRRPLSDFFPVKTGKKDANIATENGLYPFFTCGKQNLFTDNYSFDGSAILVAGNGDFSVKWYEGKFEAYQRTYVLMPNDPALLGYLYCAVKRNLSNITSKSRGSVIKFITKGNIADFEIAVPPIPEMDEIINHLNQILRVIDANKRDTALLKELRDVLLLKLMSGEIDVSKVDLTQLNSHLA